MRATVQLTGGRELARRFARLDGVTAGRTLERALVSGALVIVNGAKRRAPVRTGNLRRSIHVGGQGAGPRAGLEQPTTGTDLGGAVRSPRRALVLVGTNVAYAADVEFGTGPHLIEPRARAALSWPGAPHPVRLVHHPGTPARPFLRPAFDEEQQAAVDEIGRALAELLRGVTA